MDTTHFLTTLYMYRPVFMVWSLCAFLRCGILIHHLLKRHLGNGSYERLWGQHRGMLSRLPSTNPPNGESKTWNSSDRAKRFNNSLCLQLWDLCGELKSLCGWHPSIIIPVIFSTVLNFTNDFCFWWYWIINKKLKHTLNKITVHMIASTFSIHTCRLTRSI